MFTQPHGSGLHFLCDPKERLAELLPILPLSFSAALEQEPGMNPSCLLCTSAFWGSVGLSLFFQSSQLPMTHVCLISFATVSNVHSGTEYEPDPENQGANAGCWSLSSPLSLLVWECHSIPLLPSRATSSCGAPTAKRKFQLFLRGARAGTKQSTREGRL